jgi:hypothetical protein
MTPVASPVYTDSMAYLMTKYQDPTTYALIDLSADELNMMQSGLNALVDLYGRVEGSAQAIERIERLSAVLQRRYDDPE